MWWPILVSQNIESSISATPIALPALAFSGCMQDTIRCMFTCEHSRSMIFELRIPVASAKITMCRKLSGIHLINVDATSCVNQRIRRLTDFLTVTIGDFSI
ncbi:hypothetical protein [Candidatus Williamhamiltonella defendens]|uniref:hypothetical protein n=1 Tax=Candidatus Williamhamiltonella defendens TaxID=138072 RepID=UPI001F3E72B2|nr:hypothetical protein [Candidatus Hamiltonella defensa]